MWNELRAERVRREVVAACTLPLTTFELLDTVAGLVDQAVPSDASCWSTFDPATTMVTSAVGRGLDEHSPEAGRFFELQYAQSAPGQYRQLAVRGTTTIVLDAQASIADDGAAAVRDHLRSMGFGQELRMLLHRNGAGWGGAGLLRAPDAGRFSDEEVGFLALISPTITSAVRASLVRNVTTSPGPTTGPAVVLFDNGSVSEMTPAAAEWIAQLKVGDRGHGELPSVVGVVAVAAVAGRSVVQRARTANGTWIVLRSAPLGAGRAVVTIEPAGPPEVMSIVSAALGLTGRELDVVFEVFRGSSTKEIAANLHLSAYTVQDHLKSIFAKAGVNSRRELIAGVFFGVYAPRIGTPVGQDGFFTEPAST